jgi:spore germination protein
MDIYVIQPGDTLAAVAARFGVSVDRLLEVNGLPHPDRLIPGQAVLIPEPPQHFLMYTVIPGDTLHKLAQLFNTSVQVIAEVNDIDNPDYIEAGSELVIPGWIGIEYTVRPGDTLWSIGRQFGVSPGLIARVNRIENPSLIFPWQALIIPQQVPDVIKQEIETLAYVFPDAASLREALDTAGQCLTYAAVFQFRVDGAGGLIEPEDAQATIEVCRQQGIAPLAVVTNWRGDLFQPDLAHDVMVDHVIRTQTIASIQGVLRRLELSGVNIDFENMFPQDRPLYTRFIRELRDSLKPSGHLVTIAVAPKDSDRPDAAWVGTFDYAALGELVDIMYIMTYEWGWIGGPPMPIAPVSQVRRVLAYATSIVPSDKILQGIPLYGYDWPLPDTPESRATALSLAGAYELAYRRGANISYDNMSQSPWFRYTDEHGVRHEVWFDDPRSLRVKLELAQEFALRGVGFWSNRNVHYAFGQIWSLLCDTFSVVRL